MPIQAEPEAADQEASTVSARARPGVRIVVPLVGGVLALAAVALLAVVPGMTGAQVRAAETALAGPLNHQPAVDAAMNLFVTHSNPSANVSVDTLRAESDRDLRQYQAALDSVKSDEAALRQIIDSARRLGYIPLSRSQDLERARQRAEVALVPLLQADRVLSAAVDQERMSRAVFEGIYTETQMIAAMQKQEYGEADRLYADADRRITAVEPLARQPEVPLGIRVLVTDVRGVIDATDMLAYDLFHRNLADASSRQSEVQRGLASVTKDAAKDAIIAIDAWNDTTYKPMIASYDAGLAQLPGA
jgi:hypothetical protein